MTRRMVPFLVMAIVALTAFRTSTYGQSDFTLRISVLKELVEAIGAAGDSIKHLTDGFAHLIRTGVIGYDEAKARIVYARLVEASFHADRIRRTQTYLARGLEDYANNAISYPESVRVLAWEELTEKMKRVFNEVLALLKQVEQDRSDFVLQPAYTKLTETLTARSSLLQRLIKMQPPNTPEEIALVREAAHRYHTLIEQLEAARDELNNYLLGIKK